MSDQHDDGFGHSLTDLMASVAVMFLLIAAIFIVQSRSASEEAVTKVNRQDEAEKETRATLRELQKKLESILMLPGAVAAAGNAGTGRAEVRYDEARDPFLLEIIWAENRLGFKSGGAETGPEWSEELKRIGRPMLEAICNDEGVAKAHAQIALEGHTDTDPFPKTCLGDVHCSFLENAKLSSKRAQAVFDLLLRTVMREHEVGASLSSCLEDRFVVSGRGSAEPRDGTRLSSAPPRDQDRRVVIKIRLQPPSLSDGRTMRALDASP